MFLLHSIISAFAFISLKKMTALHRNSLEPPFHLVGVKMCIRDSPVPVHTELCQYAVIHIYMAVAVFTDKVGNKHGPCH